MFVLHAFLLQLPTGNPDQKAEWEKITGNLPITKKRTDAHGLFVPHNKDATGVKTIGQFKPAAWQAGNTLAQERAEKFRNDAIAFQVNADDDSVMEMSVSDFIKSLPLFHRATESDLVFFERNCFEKRYNARGRLHAHEICDSNDTDVLYVIRRGGVKQIQPQSAVENLPLLVKGTQISSL